MRRIAVIMAAATTACLLTSEPIDQLDLSLALSADRVLADSGLRISVSAVNRGTGAVHLETNCPLGLDLVPPANANEELSLPDVFCRSESRSVEIAPGDSATLEYHLDFRPQAHASRITRWPAGRYEVTGYLSNHGQVVRRTAPAGFDLVCSDPTWAEC
ncbi:MAG: hypothetical protein OEY20_08090 [Gemmatimonadota bacterium]|nr:hypothetical protein [Gemmatimonadota bacterium]MDH4351653.1 hypothetical protein [Gemmatimonadota bacterium]MDH5197195.1 hypothetical protein [Gemmatimonadota bacterium]